MHGSDGDSNACLIVVIPGIGGSVLESRTGHVLWKANLGAVGRLLWHPDRFASDEMVRPVGLIETRGLFPGISAFHGYHELMMAISKVVGVNVEIDIGHPENPILDARVVAFPYDFRRSITESAEDLEKQISRRLAHLGWENQPNRVIIVAHSMGGLIARYWVTLDNWNICRAILTLGTPHRGAPKALDYLVNGPSRWIPGGPGLRDLVREWPSVYELVPRYQSVEDVRSPDNGNTEGPKVLYPKDLHLPTLQDKIAQHSRCIGTLKTHGNATLRRPTALPMLAVVMEQRWIRSSRASTRAAPSREISDGTSRGAPLGHR